MLFDMETIDTRGQKTFVVTLNIQVSICTKLYLGFDLLMQYSLVNRRAFSSRFDSLYLARRV